MSILRALKDPNWDWRTVEGLHRTTTLDVNLISDILDRNRDQLEFMESTEHGKLVRLRGHKVKITQRVAEALDAVLDILSLGKRPIVKP